MIYQVIYTKQGAGYNLYDKINIEEENTNINDIAWIINRKANLQYTDLKLIKGNLNKMIFGTIMDGIIFDTPILIIQKII